MEKEPKKESASEESRDHKPEFLKKAARMAEKRGKSKRGGKRWHKYT